MKLLEIIPGEKTRKEIVDYMITFCEQVLGKGVVVCKDVPNFIGNRIGVFDISNAVNLMVEKKLKVEEVDAVIGKALGRRAPQFSGPRSGRSRYGVSRDEEPLRGGPRRREPQPFRSAALL